jgi:ribonuclease VapC
MIAVDTSALVSILLREPESERFLAILARTDIALIGPPTALELHIVASGKSQPAMTLDAAELISIPPFRLADFTADHLAAAAKAFDRFGKGRHAARLNYGDCMAYAVAKVAGCPLLYKGDDFARTDIAAAA